MVACKVGNIVTSLMASAQIHVPPALLPGRKLGTHSLGGQMGPRTCVDGFGEEENILSLLGIEPLIIDPVAQSLRLLRCPGLLIYIRVFENFRILL